MTEAVSSTKDLINLVKKYPQVWDRHCQEYREKTSKIPIWMKICEELEPTFSELDGQSRRSLVNKVTRKWYNIRDSYVKYMRGRYEGRTTQYVHYDLLSFLDKIYKNKNLKRTHSPDNSEEQDNGEDKNSDSEPFLNEVFYLEDFEQSVDANVVSPSEAKKARTEFVSVLKNKEISKEGPDQTISVISDLIEKEEDEDRAFLISLLPSMRKIPETSKLDFKIDMLKLIKTYTDTSAGVSLNVSVDRRRRGLKREVDSD